MDQTLIDDEENQIRNPDKTTNSGSQISSNDEETELDQELTKYGIKGIKKYFLTILFALIVISSLFIVYVSMTSLVYSIIPALVNSVVRLISTLSQVGFLEGFFYALVVIEYIPFFTLFTDLILKLFLSFFKNIWKNLSPSFLFQNIVDNIKNHNISYKSMAIQYSIFAFCYIIIDVFFFISGTIYPTIALIVGLLPVFRGLWRLLKHSWKSFIAFFTRKEGESATIGTEIAQDMTSTIKLSESCYTSCFLRCFVRDGSNEVELPSNLFDPAEVRYLIQWHSLIEDPRSNAMKDRKWRWDRIPCLFIIFAIVYTCIYSWVVIVNSFKVYSTSVFFSVITLIFAPFMIIFNFAQPFYRTRRFNNIKTIRYIMIVIDILYLVAAVIMVVFLILSKTLPPENVTLKDISLTSLNLTENYYPKFRPQFCTSTVGDFDILHAAPLIFLPALYKPQTKIPYDNETLRTFINYTYSPDEFDLSDYVVESFNIPLPTLLLYKNTSLSGTSTKAINAYVLFGPAKGASNYAMMVETMFYQYLPTIVQLIVPFFSIVDSFLHDLFIFMSYFLQTATFNSPYTDQVAIKCMLSLIDSLNLKQNAGKFNINLIGAGIGASVAKRIATHQLFTGSFGLLVDGFTADASTSEGRNQAKFTGLKHNIINVFTSSIFSASEKYWTANYKIESFIYLFPTHFNSMCILFSQCATDNRYVPLCTQQMDLSKYKQLVDSFNKGYDKYPYPNFEI